MDKAPPHFKSRKVKDYLEENRDTLIPVYLPTASPEFMMLEQVWNIAKRELLVVVLADIGDIIAYRHGLHFYARK